MEDMKRARPTKQIAFKFDPEEVEFSYLDGRWYDIIRVNKKSVTVRSDFKGDFTIDKHFIKSIEK